MILAPYGLAGTLTGVSYKDTDHSAQRLLDEWRQFYVLPQWDATEGQLPAAVEVVVGKCLCAGRAPGL